MNEVDVELAARIKASGLIAKEQLHASGAMSEAPDAQLKRLVQKGLLTRWQAVQLKAGHSTGFFCAHYRLDSPIAAGGMGQVFRAFDTHKRRKVALKILPARLVTRQSVERFRREAQAAMQLRHENIVETYELGQQASSYFLVMELVDGWTLKQYLTQQGKLTYRAAARIGNEVALALQHAFERGVVHRDIKPSNIMLTRQGHVKLTDLGLAKIFSEDTDETGITRTGQMMGTVDYMAPEQASNAKDADTRSDIYSLGCTLYQCLTGEIPHPHGSTFEKLLAHRDRAPTAIQELNREVPALLADLVERRMLSKRPQDRFQTPAEVAAAINVWTTEKVAETSPWADISDLIEAVAKGEVETEVSSAGMTVSHPEPAPLSSNDFRDRGQGIELAPALAMVAGVLLIVVMGAVFLWPRTGPQALTGMSDGAKQDAAAAAAASGKQVSGQQAGGPNVGGPPAGMQAAGTAAGTFSAGPGLTQTDSKQADSKQANSKQPDAAATDAQAGPLVVSGDYKGLGGAINTWWSQPGEIKGATLLDPKEPVLAGYGWMVHLLPHLGYQDLYGKFDFKKKWDEEDNLQLTATVIPAFLDPTNAKQRWEGYPFTGDGPGLTHYVGMSGIEDTRNVVAANLPRSDPRAGIFGYEQVARMNDVTDGTANTIMLIGSGRVSGPWIQGGGATIRGARAPKDQPGASYFHEITGFGSSGSPGSGAVTLMADGSVRVISKDIDPAVFRALCTIHGAESIDMQVLDTDAPLKP